MFFRLLILFTLVPLLELYLLIEVGDVIGIWPTVALVVFTGALGAFLTRLEGLRVLRQVQLEFREGRVPTAALLDGLLVVVAGAVLLTPGLITDAFGFFLLFPPGRRLVRETLAAAAVRRFPGAGPPVVDVEWDREDS